jgi:hypothetical protein
MWLRQVGPLKISAASAPYELLAAVANYASGGDRAGKRFAESLIEARQAQELTQADIQTASSAAGLDAEAVQTITRLLVVKAELWAMVVDVYEGGKASNGPVARYMGRFIPPGMQAGGTTSLQSLGKFLSWEELPVGESIAR